MKKMMMSAALALCLGAGGAGMPDPSLSEECRVRNGLPNVVAKLKGGGEVRIAYLGGSITQANPGWRAMTLAWFKEKFPQADVVEINAAISGTGSDYGACRLPGDVLVKKPDLLFVEFRVNGSAGFDCQSVEGIIRQTWAANPKTDICFVYTLHEGMVSGLKEGKQTYFGAHMEKLCNHYGIPSIDYGPEIVKRLNAGSLLFKPTKNPLKPEANQHADAVRKDENGVLVFTRDGCHPVKEGHEIYCEVVARSMETKIFPASGNAKAHEMPPLFSKSAWLSAELVPSGEMLKGAEWKIVDVKPSSECSGKKLFDLDFVAQTHRVDADRMGSFHGVLPAGMGENMTGWCPARATSEIKEENGRRFLRVTTLPGEAGGQFAIGGFAPLFPGFFRVRLTARTPGGCPVRFGLRLNEAPYTSYSGHSFDSPDWKESEYVFAVNAKRSGSVGMYVYTGVGETDLVRMTLESLSAEDFAGTIPRPPKSMKDYIRHSRFPLGLPCGWNLGRDCVDATCAADVQEPAPDGVPVLKIVSETPWELWGEAFQTAYPGEPHTLSFRYRSPVPAQVAVIDNQGHWSGSMNLPAAADWCATNFIFNARMFSKSFGLRFSGGKGPFRLDAVRVHAGKNAPPQPYASTVALAVFDGEIANDTRIQFVEDGAAAVVCKTLNAPAGSVLCTKIADLYGREKALPVRSAAEAEKMCRISYDVFPDAPVGQFRVTAWLEKNGARVSHDEEIVVTRIPRPAAWGKDAPDSPFGCHFNPCRGVVKAMKACGVNWVRLHDSGSQVSGWYEVEAEKGRWNFHDAEVACYRDAHMKIFAQLGTAPSWATHYGDLGYKRMGYFEKYLRPTNMTDWVCYVSNYVKHHENNIDEYFIWNEPWGAWWKSAADVKWYDAAKTGADFAALSRLAYDAVKKVNPRIRVSGFNSTSGEGGRRWTADVFEGGGFDCCDLIDWHYYTPHPRGLRGEKNITETPLKPIRERHPNLGGKQFYMSEGQGTSSGSAGAYYHMSGLLKASVPWPAEDVTTYSHQADMTMRYIISLLAEGNAKIFLYTSHSYQGLVRDPSFLVLLGPDGFAHPSLVAHAQLAGAIEGLAFVRRENIGRAGVKYVFAGGGKTTEVYSELDKDEVLAMAAKQPVKDVYGNIVTGETIIPGTIVYSAQ